MKNLNENKLNIECEWMKTKRILVNPNGQVLPCCYFANAVYMYDMMKETESTESKYLLDQDEPVDERVQRRNDFEDEITNKIIDKKLLNTKSAQENVLMRYFQDKDEYNLHKVSLEDIINSEWFTKTLPESWNDEKTAPRFCKKHCTKK